MKKLAHSSVHTKQSEVKALSHLNSGLNPVNFNELYQNSVYIQSITRLFDLKSLNNESLFFLFFFVCLLNNNSLSKYFTKKPIQRTSYLIEEANLSRIPHNFEMSARKHNNTCFGAYLYSAGTQHENLHQLSGMTSKETDFILRVHARTGVVATADTGILFAHSTRY